MPTKFYVSPSSSLDGPPSHHPIQESVEDFTADVNTALDTSTKFGTVTDEADGKQFSVEAAKVAGIREA